MWKRSKAIEGVSLGSMVDLKAALYEKEKERMVGVVRDKRAPKRRRGADDGEGRRNRGVEERARRDLDHLRAEADPTAGECDAALRAKQELYSRMLHGGTQQSDGNVLVDFERKRLDEWEETGRVRALDDERAERQEEEERTQRLLSAIGAHGVGSKRRRVGYAREEEEEEERGKRGRVRERGGSEAYDPLSAFDEYDREADREAAKARRIAAVKRMSAETEHGRAQHAEARQRRKQAVAERLAKLKEKKRRATSGAGSAGDGDSPGQ